MRAKGQGGNIDEFNAPEVCRVGGQVTILTSWRTWSHFRRILGYGIYLGEFAAREFIPTSTMSGRRYIWAVTQGALIDMLKVREPVLTSCWSESWFFRAEGHKDNIGNIGCSRAKGSGSWVNIKVYWRLESLYRRDKSIVVRVESLYRRSGGQVLYFDEFSTKKTIKTC